MITETLITQKLILEMQKTKKNNLKNISKKIKNYQTKKLILIKMNTAMTIIMKYRVRKISIEKAGI